MTIPASLDGIRAGLDQADAWCRDHGIPDPTRRRVLTALDEALSNVVRYGYAGRPGAFDVAFRRDGTIVLVEVQDDTAAFDPTQAAAPDTAAPLDRRRPGGLGIALVNALADEVRYERRDDRNILTMSWRITA